jgi:hypothetical protein
MSPALLQNLLRFRLSRLIYLSTRRPPRALAVSVIAVLSAQQSLSCVVGSCLGHFQAKGENRGHSER